MTTGEKVYQVVVGASLVWTFISTGTLVGIYIITKL